MKNFIYLTDRILYQIFKIILNVFLKTMDKILSILFEKYISKILNRITFKVKTGCYLLTPFELLMLKTMKLLRSYKKQINKSKNDEKVPHLEITEVVLVHCNIVNSDSQLDLSVLYALAPNKSFGQLFSYIEVWFTDQNSQPLEIDGKININY